MLPDSAVNQELNRIVIGYFSLSTLDILGVLDKYYSEDRKKGAIEYLYSLQILPPIGSETHPHCGFRGSNFFGHTYNPSNVRFELLPDLDFSHITMTAMSLIMLVIFGDLELAKVNVSGILGGLKACQRSSGCFGYLPHSTETDLRFVYSACVICYILDDWGDIDVDKLVEYILSCQRYDNGFAMDPGCESHGSACYLAVASLWLMGRLDELRNREGLIQWLINLQAMGFCGRPNKEEDSCYTFWIGGTLKLLGVLEDVVEINHVRLFVLDCEGDMGGFGKWHDSDTDPYHTHHSLYGLSILGQDGLPEIHPAFGISMTAFRKIEESILHRRNLRQ